MKSIPNPLFVLELANNHMGDVKHGLKIIKEFKSVADKYPFSFAFKFQFRNLETFLHPEAKKNSNNMLIKRFVDTSLSKNDFKILFQEAKKSFITMATPFDEESVDLIEDFGIDLIKIASCSFTDWPLLEKVALTNKPIIASTAGSTLDEISQVVNFFNNRNKEFAIMYCVGEYPTPKENMQLAKIDMIKATFKGVRIGFSTHESPDDIDNIKVAISKGASIFERHIGVATQSYNLNKYSSSPKQLDNWLKSAEETYKVIGKPNSYLVENQNESKSLQSLRRALFAKKYIKKGDEISSEDFYLAFPPSENSISANEYSKYIKLKAIEDIEPNKSITTINCELIDDRKEVALIVKKTNKLLNKNNIKIQGSIVLEISHHYGLENFFDYGLVILTLVNREYCKKLLINFKGQKHPEQFHKIKEETFNILDGEIELTIDNCKKQYKPGEIITIKPGQIHGWISLKDSIIEELSTTHHSQDSFYLDKNMPLNRKTYVTHWMSGYDEY